MFDPSKLTNTHTREAQSKTNTRSEQMDFNIHTALCLWECMNELSVNLPTLTELRDNVGTAELRDLCISLSDYVEEVWWRANGDEDRLDGHAFDWEFIPWLLEDQIDWTTAEGSPITVGLPPADVMAARAVAHFTDGPGAWSNAS